MPEAKIRIKEKSELVSRMLFVCRTHHRFRRFVGKAFSLPSFLQSHIRNMREKKSEFAQFFLDLFELSSLFPPIYLIINGNRCIFSPSPPRYMYFSAIPDIRASRRVQSIVISTPTLVLTHDLAFNFSLLFTCLR